MDSMMTGELEFFHSLSAPNAQPQDGLRTPIGHSPICRNNLNGTDPTDPSKPASNNKYFSLDKRSHPVGIPWSHRDSLSAGARAAYGRRHLDNPLRQRSLGERALVLSFCHHQGTPVRCSISVFIGCDSFRRNVQGNSKLEPPCMAFP